jgi:energy-converting hydrogenase Eha subunit H
MDFINFGDLIPVVSILAAVAFAAIAMRFYQLRIESRRSERIETLHAEEKQRLEKRIAVLERLAVDRGIQTAEQVDALMLDRSDKFAIEKGGNA